MKKLRNTTLSYSNKQKANKKGDWHLLPIILVMGILPFIVRYVQIDPKLTEFFWFSETTDYVEDLFLVYKQILLIIFSVFAFVIGFYYYKKNKSERLPIYMYFLFGYNILLVISTLVSPYRYWGIVGVFEQYESLFVHLSYLVLVLFCIIAINKQEQIDKIIKIFLGSIVVVLLIGVSQAVDKDILTSKFISMLIFPEHIWSNLESFKMQFPSGMVYLTLYNPNYAGMYLAMVIPILVAMIFYFKNRYIKIGVMICTGIAILVLFKTRSEAAIITIALFMIIAIIFLRNKLFKKKFIFHIVSVLFLGIVLVMGWRNQDKIRSIFLNNNYSSTLEKIETTEELIVSYNSQIGKIFYTVENGDFLFSITDINDNEIGFNYNEEEGIYTINLPGWENIRLQTGIFREVYTIMLKIERNDWYFTNQLGDGTFYYINNNNKFVKIKEADYVFDKRYDGLATGRGFIWSRTIPLLKELIFLGNGADSFIFTFPHDDYVNLTNNRFNTAIVNKPHSMYLQIGVQSGVLSLILYLSFFGIYFIESFKIYWKSSMDKWNHQIGLALFLSVLSYLFISLTNDSFITVTPIFWCIVGLSLCSNRINKEETRS